MTTTLKVLDIDLKVNALKEANIQTFSLHPQVLAFLMGEFLAIKVKPGATNTREAYASDLRQLGDFTGGDLSDIMLIKFLQKVVYVDKSGQPRAIRTQKRMVSTCRKFLRFLQEKGILARNYFDLIKLDSTDKGASPYIALSDIQVRNMIESYDKGTSQRLSLVLSFYLGLRCTEICSIRYCDIDGDVLTVHGKGRKVRRLALSETVLNELHAHYMQTAMGIVTPAPKRHLIESKESEGAMVDSSTVWRWFKRAAESAGIDIKALRDAGKTVSPHTARATCITKALSAGIGIRDVAVMAGHESVETTMIYDKRREEAKMETMVAIRY
jgi:integrase/recombinase XerD